MTPPGVSSFEQRRRSEQHALLAQSHFFGAVVPPGAGFFVVSVFVSVFLPVPEPVVVSVEEEPEPVVPVVAPEPEPVVEPEPEPVVEPEPEPIEPEPVDPVPIVSDPEPVEPLPVVPLPPLPIAPLAEPPGALPVEGVLPIAGEPGEAGPPGVVGVAPGAVPEGLLSVMLPDVVVFWLSGVFG
jgi:hypothetical protein